MIRPGDTLGILGGGQLGRMTAMAARRMGIHTLTVDPDPACPASHVSRQTCADYLDPAALETVVRECKVVTVEFENIPVAALEALERNVPVHPSPRALHICQNREREKSFLKAKGFPHAEFRLVSSLDELIAATEELAFPWVLKTADFGYDGKGQVKLTDSAQCTNAWAGFEGKRAVLEKWVPFEKEISAICARNAAGQSAVFPIAENIHTHHILDLSFAPARISPATELEATQLARAIAEELQIVGLIAVELFLTQQGILLVNELAPRPHNSGHYTLNACATSQFEQHVRAVGDMSLGDTRLLSPVVMGNLLGQDIVKVTSNWDILTGEPNIYLHLYDKVEPKIGRKMGHFNLLAPTLDLALAQARSIQNAISSIPTP